jgi:hypothetical protein
VSTERIKRGPGRPRKENSDRLRYRFSVGFTDLQALALERKALLAGLSLQEYIRATVLQSLSA